MLNLPELSGSIWVAIGYLLLTIFVIDSFREFTLRQLAAGAGLFLIAAAGLLAYRIGIDNLVFELDPGFVMLAVAAASLFAGVPISFVLGLTAFGFIFGTGTVPLSTAPYSFQTGISSFILLTIPFFMLAGVLMDKGGLANQLIRMLEPLTRGIRGGLLITQIVAVYLFSGVSGSKLADISAIGTVMRRPVKEAGIDESEAGALLACSAAMSETVPPSLAILILASITSLSVGALFMAGLLPAALIGIVLIVGVMWRGRGGRFPRSQPSNFGEFVRAVPGAIPALLLPLFLVGGIVFGVGTPTEVASFAVVYGLVIAATAYAHLNRIELLRAMAESATLAGITLLIVTTATLMAQMVTYDQIPKFLIGLLTSLGGQHAFLLISLGMLVVVGMLLEGLPALLIFAPLLIPIAAVLGIDPLHYGILVVIAMGIGAFSPPIGIGYYVACTLAGTTPEKAFRASIFYHVMLLVGLVVLTFVPSITTTLPHLAGFKSGSP
jgi:tripartite ATP-independent transporter DctM subunit